MPGTFWIDHKQLDEFQGEAVENMPEEISFLIRGPAGSGKTNILLLRGKWLILKGFSELRLIVFTSSLKRFVQMGCEQYGMPKENVFTCMNFFIQLLEEYGVEARLSGEFETDRIMLAGKAQALVESKGIKNVYHALLVDECQDYLDTELLVLRQLAERLVLVADSRQSIYRATHTPGLLEKLVDNNTVTLKYHYRSGLRLCLVADAILRDSANFSPVHPDCKYDEKARPSSIDAEKLPDFNSQVTMILERLQYQLDLYPDELIGVLFPKKDQLAAFEAALARSEISDKGRVVYDTMHGAKGLEFIAVHLGGCEALYRMGPTQKRLAYTSILRGKTAAAVYYSGNIPGYLESALLQLEAPRPNPALKSLFGN